MTRIENFLKAIKNNEATNLPQPKSRIEYFLKAIIDNDISNLPMPQSRVERYLDYIARNGSIGNGGSNGNAISLEDKIQDTVVVDIVNTL